MAIHHGNILHLQALDAARHEMNNPIHLCLGKGLPISQRQDDGSARPIVLIVGEQPPFRGGEVHAGPFDLWHLRNSPRQFPLQRTAIIEFLDEIGHADRRSIENLKAYSAPMRKSLGGQLQSQFMNLCAGNKDRVAASGRLIRHFRLFQLIHDSSRIFGIEVRE